MMMAFFTFGEGYHNFHHSFQHDYRNGVKRRSFDPTKWTIWALEKIGLTSDLKRVSPEKILMAEMTEAKRQLQAQHATLADAEEASQHCPQWESTYKAYHALLESFTESYHELEDSLANSVRVSRARLKQWRAETHGLLDHLAIMSRMDLPAALSAT